MRLIEHYRLLEPQENIQAGDQFKPAELDDAHWAPVSRFIGHRPNELTRPFQQRILFRRLVDRDTKE